MHECEQWTDQYSDLYCHGNHLSAKYKPSDTLDAMMSSLHNRWVGHVAQFGERSKELLRIREQWEKYEKGVNGLLSWIMEEAEKFSCEVTTCGDKGIEDHIMSCKVGEWERGSCVQWNLSNVNSLKRSLCVLVTMCPHFEC